MTRPLSSQYMTLQSARSVRPKSGPACRAQSDADSPFIPGGGGSTRSSLRSQGDDSYNDFDYSLYLYYDQSMRKNNDRISASAEADRPIHNRIAVLRTERALSRRDLAEALGVNYQTVGYIERGEYSPSLELTFRLSELFDLPVEAIFSREPFRPLSEELYAGSRITKTKENL